MNEAKKYLQNKCVVSKGDIVFIGLKELMEYTKLVQLEANLYFIEENLPDAYGLINDIQFRIRDILLHQEVEDKDPHPFDE